VYGTRTAVNVREPWCSGMGGKSKDAAWRTVNAMQVDKDRHAETEEQRHGHNDDAELLT
jgi:hypothetical protein